MGIFNSYVKLPEGTVINKNKHSHSQWCPTLFSTKIQPSRSSPPPYMARTPRTLPNGLPKSHARLGRFLGSNPGEIGCGSETGWNALGKLGLSGFSCHIRRKVMVMSGPWGRHDVCLVARNVGMVRRKVSGRWPAISLLKKTTSQPMAASAVRMKLHMYSGTSHSCLCLLMSIDCKLISRFKHAVCSYRNRNQKSSRLPSSKPIASQFWWIYMVCANMSPFASVHAPGLTYKYILTNTYYNIK